MIKITHRLKKKADQINLIPLKIKAAIDEALAVSVVDVEEDIKRIVGDKSHWFDVQVDKSNDSIKISPTDDVSSSSEKMRLYNWFIANHGEEIRTTCSECVKRNLVMKYKEHGLGGGYVY